MGYLQDLVHQDSSEEKVGRLYVYTKFEQPITTSHQFTFRGDYFHYISFDSVDEDNAITGTEVQLKYYISSVWNEILESIVDIDLILKDD
ncbi:MAG: hypothetical protein PVI90_06005, partial [Desulfobacteraceae bacterium]